MQSNVHPNVAVRGLAAEDYNQWLPLWKAYQVFYDTSIPDEVTRESWRRMLDSQEPTFGAMAFLNERPVGLVHWIHHRSNWSLGDYCYLQDLYVDKTSRGQGIGRMLIEHVYGEARKASCSRVYWLTYETNHTAMRLYQRVAERSGFIQFKKIL